MSTFRKELIDLLNKHNKDSEANTPDYVIADFLIHSLKAYSKAILLRREHLEGNNINETISLRDDFPPILDYDQELANKITEEGRQYIQEASKRIAEAMFDPAYDITPIPEEELLNENSENEEKSLNTISNNDQKVLNIESNDPIHHKILLIYDYMNRRIEPKKNNGELREWVKTKFDDVFGIFGIKEHITGFTCDETNNNPEIIDNGQLVVDISYQDHECDTNTHKMVHLIFGKNETTS